MDQDKINIDSALRGLISQYLPEEVSDYAGFLEKLAEHDKKNILVDTALEEKLQFVPHTPAGSWKSIIALIWFRRIRNVSVCILFLTTIGYTINNFIDNKGTLNASRDKWNSQHINKVDKKQKKSLETDKKTLNNETVTPGNLGRHSSGKIILQKNRPTRINQNVIAGNSGVEMIVNVDRPVTPFLNEINEIKPDIAGLKKLPYSVSELESISCLQFPPIKDPGKKKHSIFNTRTGFTIGLNLMYCIQNFNSSVNPQKQEKTNRNYEALAKNGDMPGQVFNYGISFEKPVYKGLGVSFGLNKFTLRQIQKTDFTLTEAPVFDLDGNIAGYISITPEKINTPIENKLHYILVPVNLIYGLKLNNKNSLQFKLGGGMLGMVNKQTVKFDYRTLELNTYNHSGNRLSFNSMQYGISFTRNLQNNLMLSAGYERQLLNKINQLSDNTEKIKSTINNFTLSLKYKL